MRKDSIDLSISPYRALSCEHSIYSEQLFLPFAQSSASDLEPDGQVNSTQSLKPCCRIGIAIVALYTWN